MSVFDNLVWVEKYRPKTLDEIICPDELRENIREMIKTPLAMTHLLFISRSPGTGKTTFAHVIKNEIKCPPGNFKEYNSADARKLETIRGPVKDFTRAMRSDNDIPRIILMDEIDGMLAATQKAMLRTMEKGSGNCKFILTANKESSIIKALKSRCAIIRLTEAPREAIIERLKYICDKEKVYYDHDAIEKLVSIKYPDIRDMIEELQILKKSGITMKSVKDSSEQTQEVYDMLKRGSNIFAIRTYVLGKGLDPQDVFKVIVRKTYHDEKYKGNERNMLLLAEKAGEYDYRMTQAATKDTQMIAFCASWKLLFD